RRSSDLAMLEGHLLDGRYQIKRTIGGGGMANVYLAYDLILDREVAVKVLRLEYTHDAEFIARFEREVQSATSLAHPNIVNIYDVGEESHILYMVMEYVDGMTLKEYIFKNHPVSVETAMQIMNQILSAIATAHNNERSEEHTSELQSRFDLVCRLLLENKNQNT